MLDTVIVEPHRLQAMLVWRASVPLRKKLTALTEVQVGEPPQTQTVRPIGARHGKPVFSRLCFGRSLSPSAAWRPRVTNQTVSIEAAGMALPRV